MSECSNRGNTFLIRSLWKLEDKCDNRRRYTIRPMARQRLGQHFLADLDWREQIARAIRVSPHSLSPLSDDDEGSLRVPIRGDQHCWIEIGGGHGEMTRHLLAGGTRDYGYLSVVTQFYARPELVFEIPREAFTPPPEVTSALVTLRLPGARAKLGLKDEPRFLNFIKLCFSQKRKTLVNNLRSLAKPEKIRASFASLGVRADARAEQLTVAQLAALHCLVEGF